VGRGAGIRRLGALLGLSVVWLLLWCAPALAHARLLQEQPAAGASLAESPDRVRLEFSEPVDAEFSPLEVYDAGGHRVDVDNARIDPDDARVLLVDLKELSEGPYDVEWRVTSIDGHVIQGKYKFSVAAGAGEEPGVEENAGRPEQEPAAAEGAEETRPPILAYSALSLGAVGLVALLIFLGGKLVRRPKA
jgi:methionine-rich copper-binding protein CopC